MSATAFDQSRAFHYGDGIFRTCLNIDGHIIDIDQHSQKATSDAARLGIAVDPGQLRAALVAAALPGEAVIKLTVWRAGAARGYAPAGDSAEWRVAVHPLPAWRESAWSHGIELGLSPVRLAEQPLLAGIKHLNRLEQVLAAQALVDSGRDEAVCLDTSGRLVCGTRSNLYWVSGGVLHTPPLDRCGVAGVMRDRILALASRLGVECARSEAGPEALDMADEIFISNALVGIWPVSRWHAAGSRILEPGPVTRRLQSGLEHPLPRVPTCAM